MSMPIRLFVIVNPNAARAKRVWPSVRETLGRGAINFEAYETKCRGDAQRAARRALCDGWNLIAVVGGDGTVGEVAAGFFEPLESHVLDLRLISEEAALALIPAGTGDDFARGLVGHRAPVEAWLARLLAICRHGLRGRVRLVDMVRVLCAGASPFVYLNAATIGFGAEVAARVAEQDGIFRLLPGEARFMLAALAALSGWRERPVCIRIDGARIESRSNLIAITSGPYAGGGMMLAPTARADDGFLDLMVAAGVTRRVVLRELPRARDGKHLLNPAVRLLRGKTVYIEPLASEAALRLEADGEVRGAIPAQFEVVPRVLRLAF